MTCTFNVVGKRLKYWIKEDGMLVLVLLTAALVGGLVFGLDNQVPLSQSDEPENSTVEGIFLEDVGGSIFAGKAELDVYSSPRQAHVIVEGDTLGPTPLVQSSLQAGARYVQITMPGYATVDTMLTLFSDRPNRLIVSLTEDTPDPTDLRQVHDYRPAFPVAPEQFESARQQQREQVRGYLSKLNKSGHNALSSDAAAKRPGW